MKMVDNRNVDDEGWWWWWSVMVDDDNDAGYGGDVDDGATASTAAKIQFDLWFSRVLALISLNPEFVSQIGTGIRVVAAKVNAWKVSKDNGQWWQSVVRYM